MKIHAVFEIDESEYQDTAQGIIELGGEITNEED